jgi:hypothetical protein
MHSNLGWPNRPFGVFRYLRGAGLATVGSLARAAVGDPAEQEGAPAAAEPAHPYPPPPPAGAEGAIWWGREQLLSCDASGLTQTCPEAIDVTGPARCLVFGPYLPLEPGLWRATTIFDLCPEAAHRRMIVQFGAMPEFTTREAPRQAGRHLIEMDYHVRPKHQVEVRLLMTMAGFHGELRFAGAFLKRLGDAR